MIEKQIINDKEVWIKVDAHPAHRNNPNIIPTEYFSATYYTQNPENAAAAGILIKDDEGEIRLFESPVAALSHAAKLLQKGI